MAKTKNKNKKHMKNTDNLQSLDLIVQVASQIENIRDKSNKVKIFLNQNDGFCNFDNPDFIENLKLFSSDVEELSKALKLFINKYKGLFEKINNTMSKNINTRPYGDVYVNNDGVYNYHPKTKEELQEIIKKRLLDEKDPNKIVNLNDIDVSKITDMSKLFHFDEFRQFIRQYNTYVFNNVDISMWDVSNVENMNSMFEGCTNFNCDLSRWDVSKVEDMSSMFEMFYGCASFNSDLSRWNVSNVKSMGYMFSQCTNFNCDLSKWDVSNVEDMRSMFVDCSSFKSDLSRWDVSNVKNMNNMFSQCTNFNCDLSKWDVSNVEDMCGMFYNCIKFNCDLSGWDVSNVYKYCYFNYYYKVNKKGEKVGSSTLPKLPNEKCPKWKE